MVTTPTTLAEFARQHPVVDPDNPTEILPEHCVDFVYGHAFGVRVIMTYTPGEDLWRASASVVMEFEPGKAPNPIQASDWTGEHRRAAYHALGECIGDMVTNELRHVVGKTVEMLVWREPVTVQ